MDYSARIYRAFTATHNKVDIYSWSNEFCSLFPNTNCDTKTKGRVVPFSTVLIQIDENDSSRGDIWHFIVAIRFIVVGRFFGRIYAVL